MDIKLWKHQQDAVDLARGRDHFALFFDPGCGKTLTTITILREKFNEQKKLIPTLVLAPVIVLKNWKDEWLKFSKVPEQRILVLSGSTKKRIEQLRGAMDKFNGNFIAITNYEAVIREDFRQALLECNFACVVLDESHRIKNPSSKRTKSTILLSDRAKYKYLLTGTPILNDPMDIFSQFRALDGGKSFGSSFFKFRATYFEDKNKGMPSQRYFPNWKPKKTSYEKFNEIIRRSSLRAVKEECLDLPPLVKKVIKVDLSPEQKKHYEEMKKYFVSMLNDEAIVAQIAITKMLRMSQITTGVLKTEENEYILKKTPREAALKELLEDITPNHKVLVWAVFRGNYEIIKRVCNELKISYVEAHGSISNNAKYNAVDTFNNDEKCRVFIGHPGALGIGINLIAASYSIYYSRNHSLEQDLQSEARNYRGGSEIHKKITRIDLVAEDTIDEAILEALDKKLDNAEKILNYVKEKI